jgi:hypothetical protein
MNGRKKRGVRKRNQDQNSIEEAVRAQDMRPKSRKVLVYEQIKELDDESFDILFPDGDDTAVDRFISDIDEKWVFDVAGAFIRRAVTGRRRKRRRKSETDSLVSTKAKTGPCWPGYEQVGMKRGKSGKMVPNCVPISTKSAKPLKDPKGGLTAAGRAHFNRQSGGNLRPGVKGAADTPQKMRRKGSFLTRFFTNPSGPLTKPNGEPTRLALSAAAWGEPVPKNAQDAARLAAKGRNLLKRYENTKKKK